MENKPLSYRRWRKKLSKPSFPGRKRKPDIQSLKPVPWQNLDSLHPVEKTLEMLAIHLQWEKMRLQQMAQDLTEDYLRHTVFRQAKVSQLKYFIQQGLYHIPSKKIVEKWFPTKPASDSIE
jgi:anti-sigma28 factor (negative regulator of flagellin synthesis)